MWITQARYHELSTGWWKLKIETERLQLKNTEVERMNARLGSDLDWFKHRLNQVERERGQLIQAAIGVKISIPEFVPSYEDPAVALQQMPDLSSVGEDALDQGEPETDADPGIDVDYSMMPGYSGKR